jgi:hypothetical protein
MAFKRVSVGSASDAPSSAPSHRAPAKPALTGAQLATAFDGRLEPARTSLLYRLLVLLMCGAMVLLPVVYIGIIVAAAAGVLWYSTHASAMLTAVRPGRAWLLALLAYIAPLIAGGLLVMFMILPLFWRSKKRERPMWVSRREQPLLYAYRCRSRAAALPVQRAAPATHQFPAADSFRQPRAVGSQNTAPTFGQPPPRQSDYHPPSARNTPAAVRPPAALKRSYANSALHRRFGGRRASAVRSFGTKRDQAKLKSRGLCSVVTWGHPADYEGRDDASCASGGSRSRNSASRRW